MRGLLARLTPLGWVVLGIVALVVVDLALPFAMGIVLCTIAVWAAAYFIAFLGYVFNWD